MAGKSPQQPRVKKTVQAAAAGIPGAGRPVVDLIAWVLVLLEWYRLYR